MPDVYMDYCRRRVLVSEWIDGVNLSDAPSDEVAKMVNLSQECYLRQLLEVGYFHNDPHPGNLLLMDDRSKGSICIIDFGLMVEIPEKYRLQMISAIIHLSNKNFDDLAVDFIKLGFLPEDVDKSRVVPVIDKLLSPYITRGGGANKFKSVEEYSFSKVTREVLKARLELPFSIPPYIAQLARAIAILEGIALKVDPEYKLVMEAYPFVTRNLFKDQRDGAQQLLRETLYDEKGRIKPQRLSVLIN